MQAIEILYTCSTSIAILASIPQVRQLLVTKSSEELNVATWALWLCTQFISLTYAVSLQIRLWIIVNCVWIVFYAIMLSLILYYRNYPGGIVTKVLRRARLRRHFQLKPAIATEE